MKINILNKSLLSNQWGEYAQYNIQYLRNDGHIELQVREMQDNGHGAAVLLYHLEKREIVLIKQFRLAAFLYDEGHTALIEVCAGLVVDDDPQRTIINEIKEEVGYIINDPIFLFKGFATPGAKTEMIYFFKAAYSDQTIKMPGGGLKEEQEDIEVMHLPFDEAYEMIFKGQIIDQKTITLLFYAKQYIFN